VLFATMPAFIGEPWSCAVLVLSYYDLFHFWSARVPALRKLMFVHSNKHTALNTTCFVTRSHLQICSKNFTFQFLSYVEAPLAFLCVMVSWLVVCNFRFSTNFSSSLWPSKIEHFWNGVVWEKCHVTVYVGSFSVNFGLNYRFFFNQQIPTPTTPLSKGCMEWGCKM
jgi:hypothetical protein